MRCFVCGIDFDCRSQTCGICDRPLETDSDRYFKAGMDALAAGDLGESIALLRGCLEVDANHLTGRFNLGIALSLADRCDLALEHLLMVAQEDPSYPGLFTALGQAAFGSYLFHREQAEARRSQMIRLLREAVARDREDVDAYFSLGNAYIALEQAGNALPYLKQAAALDPSSSAVYFTMAKALKMLGRYREAALMVRKSLVISPPDDRFREEMEELLADVQRHAASGDR